MPGRRATRRPLAAGPGPLQNRPARDSGAVPPPGAFRPRPAAPASRACAAAQPPPVPSARAQVNAAGPGRLASRRAGRVGGREKKGPSGSPTRRRKNKGAHHPGARASGRGKRRQPGEACLGSPDPWPRLRNSPARTPNTAEPPAEGAPEHIHPSLGGSQRHEPLRATLSLRALAPRPGLATDRDTQRTGCGGGRKPQSAGSVSRCRGIRRAVAPAGAPPPSPVCGIPSDRARSTPALGQAHCVTLLIIPRAPLVLEEEAPCGSHPGGG